MAVTDYNTSCGDNPLSFEQMLASTIVGYKDIQGVTHYRINGLEYENACSELSDFLDCDTSHLDPERQLVENVFALDECSRLALKIFSNTDTEWSDYEECGEVPLTWIQMLARSIVTYGNGNKINAVLDTDVCTELTAFLNCSTNNIEPETALVTNLFAVDSCGRLFLKLFINQSTMTDFNTACTETPQTFMQLLAQCIVSYSGHYYLNVASVSGNCDDLLDFWSCSNNHIEPERALYENLFATDSCGNMALKIFNNQGEGQ